MQAAITASPRDVARGASTLVRRRPAPGPAAVTAGVAPRSSTPAAVRVNHDAQHPKKATRIQASAVPGSPPGQPIAAFMPDIGTGAVLTPPPLARLALDRRLRVPW